MKATVTIYLDASEGHGVMSVTGELTSEGRVLILTRPDGVVFTLNDFTFEEVDRNCMVFFGTSGENQGSVILTVWNITFPFSLVL